MTKIKFRIGTSAVLVCAIMLAIGCSGSQNANQNANRVNSTPASGATDNAVAASDCSGNTAGERRANVMNGVETNIKAGRLKKQFTDRTFNFGVSVLAGDKLSIVVGGTISGEGTLEDLAKALKPFVKKECVQKVMLTDSNQNLASASGFLWLGCEYPNVPCPNGECAPACPALTPVPTSNTNGNSANKTGN